MNEQNYTSLKLSKLLFENGFKGESEYSWRESSVDAIIVKNPDDKLYKYFKHYPAYDILNDLCVKYAKEIFGTRRTCVNCQSETRFEEDGRGNKYETCNCDFKGKLEVETDLDIRLAIIEISLLLQQNKKEEAEKYIWKHSVLNK